MALLAFKLCVHLFFGWVVIAVWRVYLSGLRVEAGLENRLVVPQNVKHRVTINPTILLLVIDPKEIRTYIHTKSCPEIFIVAKW